jgi:aspartyl-tRNA(Asn)/glutamyl-tRNA(Gln) amidotransferase subunit A
MIREELLFAPISELAPLVKLRKLSPIDLTQACLDRLESLGPALGAVVTITRERALAQAHRANQEILAGKYRGPLHGIPYGAKDLLATRGVPTTWGAEPLRDQVLDLDATVVQRLEEAGAVLVAKLAMVELAGAFGYDNPDASFTGPCRSPWNTDFWSGGSSSGSAAAVAAGLVPFAIGSETSGSILTPCAYSGTSGLRPTYGRVSRHGAMALSWSLDKVGPICRNAADCALVLAAIAGADEHDPTTEGLPPLKPATLPKLPRIGVLRDATAGADPEVAANFERSLEVLSGFARVERDVRFPDLPWGAAVGVIVDAEGASAFRDFIESGKTRQLRAKADRTGAYAAMMTLAVDYLEAMRTRVPMRAALDGLLSRYDAVVAPTRLGVAPPIGYDFDKPPKPRPKLPEGAPKTPATIPAGNLAGVPALCVPNGFGAEGLPTSLQFLGAAFSETTLVALAERFQAETDWHRRRPPTPR